MPQNSQKGALPVAKFQQVLLNISFICYAIFAIMNQTLIQIFYAQDKNFCQAKQLAMAAELTGLAQKIAVIRCAVAESCAVYRPPY
jgi:hypothetical protein